MILKIGKPQTDLPSVTLQGIFKFLAEVCSDVKDLKVRVNASEQWQFMAAASELAEVPDSPQVLASPVTSPGAPHSPCQCRTTLSVSPSKKAGLVSNSNVMDTDMEDEIAVWKAIGRKYRCVRGGVEGQDRKIPDVSRCEIIHDFYDFCLIQCSLWLVFSQWRDASARQAFTQIGDAFRRNFPLAAVAREG
ncbi:hypothetical protein E2C01_003593 [Portunus trituberculatus]|uniref:Uncharacterized protein n=1 Tax=Portunus trituberculatus TaxID=210409 RepID=A0A5B7CNE8_PORTR|nr:hypothetical protein [Portunus trituberculatus]